MLYAVLREKVSISDLILFSVKQTGHSPWLRAGLVSSKYLIFFFFEQRFTLSVKKKKCNFISNQAAKIITVGNKLLRSIVIYDSFIINK